jgi:hypothetical protein
MPDIKEKLGGQDLDMTMFGKTKETQDRRLAVVSMQEDGMKACEIAKHLDIKIKEVYNDINYCRKRITREVRELVWDMKEIREAKLEMGDAKHMLHKLGYRNYILKLRQDMRRRSGMYVERVHHTGGQNIEIKMYVPAGIEERKEKVVKATVEKVEE